MKKRSNDQELFTVLQAILEGVNQLNSHKKEYLTIEEAAVIFGVSKSYIYKLTSGKKVNFYKPSGKVIFISRSEFEDHIKSGRVTSNDDIKDFVNKIKL
jgi:excisionase family DNA binding protein